jgi:fructose-specific phosphotransferase system IIB component
MIKMKIACITACPCGAAHSRLAGAALQAAAKKLGHEIYIEEHGGWQDTELLTAKQIREAQVVIMATAIIVEDLERFDGKPTLEVNIKRAITHPEETIQKAVDLI